MKTTEETFNHLRKGIKGIKKFLCNGEYIEAAFDLGYFSCVVENELLEDEMLDDESDDMW